LHRKALYHDKNGKYCEDHKHQEKSTNFTTEKYGAEHPDCNKKAATEKLEGTKLRQTYINSGMIEKSSRIITTKPVTLKIVVKRLSGTV
jgi:hypothetical protein